MGLIEWIKAHLHTPVDYDLDGTASCVDLVNAVMAATLSGPRWHGNAIDIAGQLASGWKWVPNNPTNYPSCGDVVVWGADYPGLAIGQYGHTAIALAADSAALLTADQNWPEGSGVALVLHDYRDVVGWQHRG